MKILDKKAVKYSMLALNVVLMISLVMVLNKEEPKKTDLSIHTQQDLGKAINIRPNMGSGEVKKIMGVPVVIEFSNSEEEWHYCKTGYNVDEYVVVKLSNGKVTDLQNYTVSWLDMVFKHTQTPTEALIESGGLGDCKLTVRWGTYNQKTPNKSN